jgi:formate/nitrite transporter FocA (FNT family)
VGEQDVESKKDEPSDRPRSVTKPEKGTRLTALEIHDNLLAGGSEDTKRPTPSLLWSALASGLVIGFSLLAGAFLSTMADGEAAKRALRAAGYPLGFIFVVLGRSELFTENTLEPVLPLLHERTGKRLRALLRMWALLLCGNMAGAALFGALVADTPVIASSLRGAVLDVAVAGTSGGFAAVFYRGIFAGWLIALMGWLLGSTGSRIAQILIIWICTASIGAFEFRHSVAGAVEAFFRIFSGNASAGEMIGGFIVPAVLGNAVGGVVLVALLNYAQVYAELPHGARTRSNRPRRGSVRRSD